MKKKRKGILPTFELTEVCEPEDPFAREVTIAVAGATHTYYVRPVSEQIEYGTRKDHCYNSFPVSVNTKHIPWDEGNLFLLDTAEESASGDTRGLLTKADDLTNYCHFLEANEIDMYDFPLFKNARPTYSYRSHLIALAKNGEISATVANRRINTVVALYRNLEINYGLRFKNPPWKTRTSYLPMKSVTLDTGRMVRVEHTDLSIPKSIRKPITTDCIIDGEQLKPLNYDEQKILVQTLLSEGNLEMCLIFFLGLFTGARIQTICTLRARFFDSPVCESERPEVPVGPGTGCDTKFDKRRSLRIFDWLYNKIHIYVKSQEWERRKSMYEKKHGVDPNGPAVFYTSQGNMFYNSKTELQTYDPMKTKKVRKDGAAIRNFISESILPKMRANFGSRYHFKFHNTRATFGQNLLGVLRIQEDPRLNEHEILELLADELWHDSTAVTERYVKHKPDQQLRRKVQLQYEVQVEELARQGMSKLYDD